MIGIMIPHVCLDHFLFWTSKILRARFSWEIRTAQVKTIEEIMVRISVLVMLM
jgi:hypothetical protein